jgi:ORF6N domain.
MFQLTREEFESLRSQSVISKTGRGGRRYLPYAFTQEGVAMLSSVLRSKRAVQVNIEIMRAFVRMRSFALTNRELARKIADLESRYDGQFEQVFEALNALLASPEPHHGRRMGFQQTKDE